MLITSDVDIQIKKAARKECGDVALLLKRAGLPIHDIDPDLEGFFVAYDECKLVGTVGVETFGEIGLLRSLAVEESFQNQGIGAQLSKKALNYAKSQGLKKLYLLTETADNYFARYGFTRIDRKDVPQAIRETEQFSSICPASAVVMEKILD